MANSYHVHSMNELLTPGVVSTMNKSLENANASPPHE